MARRTKIAVSNLAARVGGGGTYILNLVPELARLDQGTRYTIFLNKGMALELEKYKLPRNVEVSVPIKKESILKRLAWEQFVLPLMLFRKDYDLLFCPGNIATLLSPCPLVLAIRYTTVFDEIYPEFISRRKVRAFLQAFSTRLSSLRADRIIFVSEHSRRMLCDILRVAERKTSVIYHGRNPDFKNVDQTARAKALEKYGLSGEYILTVSNIMAHKNQLRLLKAFELLVERHPELTHVLVVAGAPQDVRCYNEMQGYLSRKNIRERVAFPGAVPYDELPALYSGASVFVFPSSSSETFGHPLIEAMSCGTPVAASNASAIPEICGDAALYFDPLSVDDMASCIERLLRDEALRSSLVARGTARALDFSWEKTALSLQRLFTDILGRDLT